MPEMTDLEWRMNREYDKLRKLIKRMHLINAESARADIICTLQAWQAVALKRERVSCEPHEMPMHEFLNA